MEAEESYKIVYYNTNENIAPYEDYITEPQQLWNFCIWESIFLGIPKWLFHLMSLLTGVYSLVTMSQDQTGLIVVFICFLSAYHLLLIDLNISKLKSQNKILKMVQKVSLIDHGLVILLVLFQYAILDPFVWLGIRGIMMVFIMKMMSLFHDIKNHKTEQPTLFEFLGYLFSGVNVIFGPWISYDTYIEQHRYPTRKTYWWILGVARAYGISLFFLVTSNCLTDYFIPEDSNRLLVGYKEALTYRTSHYFICFLSEAMMLAAGWKNASEWFDEKQWYFTVTKPLGIEFPPHLAAVVIKWNMPMHAFLKKYVYKKWIHHGKFWAILMTFIMSSLFHGFEIKVSMVLISIGIFSYMQILIRDKVAELFNCCVKVRSCEEKRCNHYYKKYGWFCRLLNLIFGIFTVLHLIFLGILMDPTTDEVGIHQKWNNLYYFSLWIMVFDLSFINFF